MTKVIQIAVAQGLRAAGLSADLPADQPEDQETKRSTPEAYNLDDETPDAKKAKQASSQAHNLSSVASQEQTEAAHSNAAEAHRNAAALMNAAGAFREQGMHLKMAAFHDDQAQRTAQAQSAENFLVAKAKNSGIQNSAEALAAVARTPVGNAAYELYRDNLGRRR